MLPSFVSPQFLSWFCYKKVERPFLDHCVYQIERPNFSYIDYTHYQYCIRFISIFTVSSNHIARPKHKCYGFTLRPLKIKLRILLLTRDESSVDVGALMNLCALFRSSGPAGRQFWDEASGGFGGEAAASELLQSDPAARSHRRKLTRCELFPHTAFFRWQPVHILHIS